MIVDIVEKALNGRHEMDKASWSSQLRIFCTIFVLILNGSSKAFFKFAVTLNRTLNCFKEKRNKNLQ